MPVDVDVNLLLPKNDDNLTNVDVDVDENITFLIKNTIKIQNLNKKMKVFWIFWIFFFSIAFFSKFVFTLFSAQEQNHLQIHCLISLSTHIHIHTSTQMTSPSPSSSTAGLAITCIAFIGKNVRRNPHSHHETIPQNTKFLISLLTRTTRCIYGISLRDNMTLNTII